MLARMESNCNSHIQPVGIWKGMAALGNSLSVSFKVKHLVTAEISAHMLIVVLEIQKCQKLETTQMSFTC